MSKEITLMTPATHELHPSLYVVKCSAPNCKTLVHRGEGLCVECYLAECGGGYKKRRPKSSK